MSTSKAIKRAVRYALLTGATMAVALPVNAADDEIIQEVIVTGSLIPMNLEAPGVPVTIMTSSDIAASGVTGDMLDVLTKTVPFFYGGLNIGSDNGNISSGSTNGGSMVSLRNRSTLVLINGRRAAVSPVAASGGFTFTDVSLIPVSAVERVEILADGASATYGADAVGGVVNIIMKDNFDGVQVGGRYGFDDGGDYNERSAYFTAGTSTADTSVTFSAEWKKSDPLIQADRSWGRGIYRTNSFAGSIFDLESDADEVFYFLDPSMNAPDGSLNIPITQAAAAGYSGPLATNAQYFDLADKPTMLLGSERKSAMLVWDHSISNYFGLFGDVLVSNTKSWSQLNAQPVGGVVAADHPFNPFDQDVYVTNRFQAFPRQYETDTTGWRGVVGARGDIVGSWKYEVAANYNRAESTHRNPGLIDANAYFAAVDLAYSDDPEEVAMAYNPFARVQAPGVLESFQGEAWEGYVSRLTSYDAKVYGDLFSLPAGVVRLAVGASTAKESLSFVNDRFSREGLWLQATPSHPSTPRWIGRATTPKHASRSSRLTSTSRASMLSTCRSRVDMKRSRRPRVSSCRSSRCVGSRWARPSRYAPPIRSPSPLRRCSSCLAPSARASRRISSCCAITQMVRPGMPTPMACKMSILRPSIALRAVRTWISTRRLRRTGRSVSIGVLKAR